MNFGISSCTKWTGEPRTPLAELTALLRSPSWWGGASVPLPKNPTPALGLRVSFFFIFKHSWAAKRSWKISHGGPGKVLDFFVSERVGTL